MNTFYWFQFKVGNFKNFISTKYNKPYGENVTSSKHAASMQQASCKQAASKEAAFDGSSLTMIN